ncbi:MAG: hypothetical protein Q8P70_01580 [bacterium]|nr:hypothetical protein [bacterium]
MNIRQKTLTLLVGSLCVALGALIFLIIPMAGEVFKDSLMLKELKEQIAQMGADERSIRYFEGIIASRSEEMNLISNVFVDRTRPIAFMEFLESLGGTVEVTPGLVQKADTFPWDYIEFRIVRRGSFRQLFSFLQGVEHSPYLVNIRNASFALENDGLLRLTLLARVYVHTP